MKVEFPKVLFLMSEEEWGFSWQLGGGGLTRMRNSSHCLENGIRCQIPAGRAAAAAAASLAAAQ